MFHVTSVHSAGDLELFALLEEIIDFETIERLRHGQEISKSELFDFNA